MGCPAGVGPAGLPGRAVTCPHPPPPLRREFQSERARGLLLGRNHPARRRRVGRRHLTARPRPPRVRGGGSVCWVTNGPSRPARPLAPARRRPICARSSRRLQASCRPARSRPAVPHPEGHSRHPARWLASGDRDERLNRSGARRADPQVSVHGGRGMLRGQCGEHAGLRMRTRVRVIRRLSLQSESQVPLRLGLLSLLRRVGGNRKSLDLGEGFRKFLS